MCAGHTALDWCALNWILSDWSGLGSISVLIGKIHGLVQTLAEFDLRNAVKRLLSHSDSGEILRLTSLVHHVSLVRLNLTLMDMFLVSLILESTLRRWNSRGVSVVLRSLSASREREVLLVGAGGVSRGLVRLGKGLSTHRHQRIVVHWG